MKDVNTCDDVHDKFYSPVKQETGCIQTNTIKITKWLIICIPKLKHYTKKSNLRYYDMRLLPVITSCPRMICSASLQTLSCYAPINKVRTHLKE